MDVAVTTVDTQHSQIGEKRGLKVQESFSDEPICGNIEKNERLAEFAAIT
jgi:hypothetical protein